MTALVVMPAYNEEASLAATLKELASGVPSVDVLVVDDGSTDATAAIARKENAAVLRLPFNLGVGGAVRAGLRYAVEHHYERAVIVDADGQHPPAAIEALLAALDGGADLAIGTRFSEGSDAYPVGWLRHRAMRLLHRIVHWRTGQAFTDTTSGFRAFDRPLIELLARDYPVEYLADTVEVLIMVCEAGYTVVEVPTPMRRRAAGQASTRRLKLVVNYLRLLIGILASATRHRPRRQS